MSIYKYIITAVAFTLLLASCQQKEVASSEAVILTFRLYSSSDEDLYYTDFKINDTDYHIYNPDSCKYKTSLNKVMPVIIYKTTPYSISFNGVEWKGDTIELDNHFSVLVTAADKKHTREYSVDVNIHTVDADSIRWRRVAYDIIPTKNVVATKALQIYGETYLFAQLESGDGIIYTTKNHISWNKIATYTNPINVLSINKYTYTDSDKNKVEEIYAISADKKQLYKLESDNTFSSVSAPEGDLLLLAGSADNKLLILTDNVDEMAFYAFDGSSSTLSSKIEDKSAWPYSDAFTTDINGTPYIIGGTTKEGNLLNSVYSTEYGTEWTNLLKGGISAYGFTPSKSISAISVLNSIFAIGGLNNKGINKTVYCSNDYGFSWKKALTSQQLPSGFTPRYAHSTFLDKNGDMWIIGGKDENEKLIMDVWRGHLNRYDFKKK